MTSANEVRATFLDYFAARGHRAVASSPLVPRNDPTLMFVNSGMVQFKDVFTGHEVRDYTRAVTAQKCVRAGGKHNDLENVGYTARHHTFFEMLGNFSFGDYFKEEAIALSWGLVTGEFGLPADRLLVTVYDGDEDAARLWRHIAGLDERRIIRIATSDNFWQMGDTGPCGPCSEIFYDHGDAIPGGPPGSAEEDGDRFIEIWNLVFMQFEQMADGTRVPLPNPSIDTGMGLERMTALLQGTNDNYRIDLLRGIIEASADLTGVDPDGPQAASHKVIADHLRAAAFLIADGVTPGNEGRGYVLRRIMRRAMRHAHMLGAREPLLHRLAPTLNDLMAGHYQELNRAGALIAETLKLEETRFRRTLERGLKLLDAERANLGAGGQLDGGVAFTLYDTYGFPLDLTQDILRAVGASVDMAGFDAAMAAQRDKARKAWSGSGDRATERIWFDIRDRFGAGEFLGYDTGRAEGVLRAILRHGREEVDRLTTGEEAALLFNQTPFYGESGGQMGDAGVIETAAGARFTVTDTKIRLDGLIIHLGRLECGALAPGDVARLTIDGARRTRLRANHSATHLLHQALRDVLGDHVTQKGSLVAPDQMRFDFSHPRPVTTAELTRVEAKVNAQIRANLPVRTRLMTPEDAVAVGALALFGEKYGTEVRVVSMGGGGANGNDGDGDDIIGNDATGGEDAGAGADQPWSVELCGGTHVARSGDIGLFRIRGESGVAAGIRRVEVLTGAAALADISRQQALLDRVAGLVRVPTVETPARIESLLAERKRLERTVTDLRRQLAMGGGGGKAATKADANTDTATDSDSASAANADAGPEHIGDIPFIGRILRDVPPRELKPMADEWKRSMGRGVVALVSVTGGKASLVVGIGGDLAGPVDAVALSRAGAVAMGGKGGGGRADMAQAGGPDGDRAEAALTAIRAALADAVGTTP